MAGGHVEVEFPPFTGDRAQREHVERAAVRDLQGLLHDERARAVLGHPVALLSRTLHDAGVIG